jgi:hypothetical protein
MVKVVQEYEVEPETVVTSPRVARDEKPYFMSYKTVNYILGIIEALLFLRFIFKLTGANPAAGIVRMIYDFSEILMLPFRFIFPTASAGAIRLEWSVLVAMAFYVLLVYGIMGLIDLFRTADTNKV